MGLRTPWPNDDDDDDYNNDDDAAAVLWTKTGFAPRLGLTTRTHARKPRTVSTERVSRLKCWRVCGHGSGELASTGRISQTEAHLKRNELLVAQYTLRNMHTSRA